MIHLDADIVIAYLNGNRDIARRIRIAAPEVAISAIVLAELYHGAAKSGKPAQNHAKIRELLQSIHVAVFDETCAACFASVKLELRLKGRPTGEIDALIAATALAKGAELITHNTRHFEHISGLKIADWLA